MNYLSHRQTDRLTEILTSHTEEGEALTETMRHGPEQPRIQNTGLIAHPFASSLALLTHTLAPHSSLCTARFVCMLTHSRACKKVNN